MVSRERFLVTIILLAYLILISICFILIGERFKLVEGYGYRDLDPIKYSIGFLLLLCVSFSIPLFRHKVSTSVAWFVFYFHVIPSVLFFSAAANLSLAFYFYFIFWVGVCFSLVGLFLRFSIPDFSISKTSSVLGFIVFFALCAISILVLYRDFGFRLSTPSLYDVYDVRSEYKLSVSRLGGYFTILVGYFFSPLLAFLGFLLFKRGRLLFSLVLWFLAVFMSYQVYAVTGFKSVAFMLVVVMSYAVIIARYKNASYGLLVSGLVLSLVVLGLVLNLLLGFEDLLFHWIRRSLVGPGINSLYFYEHDIINGFSRGDYAANVISMRYYGQNGSANTGVIGDGVFRYGWALFWVNFLVFVILMRTLDVFVGKNNRLVAALFLPASYALANSSITTVLLTYGLVPMIVFVHMFRKFIRDA